MSPIHGLFSLGLSPINVLDIGANVGIFSRVCKQEWNNASFTLIEANSSCEPQLKAAGFPYHIEVLSDRDGKEVTFYKTTDSIVGTGNSIYKEISDHYSDEKLIVENRVTKTLDTMFPGKLFDFIKMDTQGSELDIIRGGKKLVSRASSIVVEVAMAECNEGAATYTQIRDELRSLGFNKMQELEDHIYPRSDHPTLRLGQIVQRDVIFFK